MNTKISKKTELVVNYHITEACNFKCSYCFAKWNKDTRELLHNETAISKLMDEITKLQSLLNQKYITNFKNIRLNLVGGETFLYKKQVLTIIKEAKKRGFALSAITNGSKLDNQLIELLGTNFCSVGFSVDSINETTNLQIGRSEKNKAMDVLRILSDIKKLRQINPNIDIKINTVVSSLNHNESLSTFIMDVKPSKWKIFKVLPSVTNAYSITNNDFLAFLARHQHHNEFMFSEDNDEMTDSYLMIDPLGRFFQNSTQGDGYIYSKPIVEIGIDTALGQINFDITKFFERYQQKSISIINIA